MTHPKFSLLTQVTLGLAALSAVGANADWTDFFKWSPAPPPAAERPPQFVLLAFDGSLNNPFWEESLTFGKENRVPFTYFMSGVYFLLDKNKDLYREPTHGPGKSAIGWGGRSADALTKRMGYLKRAYAEGNELGSHANGHFDGTTWSYDDWKLEFSQFPGLIFDAFANNQIAPPKDFDLGFGMDEVKGFRAPLLGQNPHLYDVLAEEGFRYDTSKMADMNYWPKKEKGLWNFPLAFVGIAGTAKKTISMDYNFFFVQSGGVEEKNPIKREVYRKEMLQTYFNYFQNNYNGNRAPIHIGHHFAKWNGSAYWNAMKTFAQTVCGLPEVKCVTYRELTEYMESQSPADLAAYQRGDFPRLEAAVTIPKVMDYPNPLAVTASITDPNTDAISVKLAGKDAAMLAAVPDLQVDWELDGTLVGSGFTIPSSLIKEKMKAASTLAVVLHFGELEILRSTRKLTKDLINRIVYDRYDFESRALKGDLPEAHFRESSTIAPPLPRILRPGRDMT
ncbi:MAG: hypothetical protein JST04_11790 [Bdellovibrionales bacterium]|nr:hypothetical protein [Bdellovibrionales bacterium]